MDLFGALPDEVRCRRFYEHEHIFRDYPLSKIENGSKATIMKDTENFHKVGYRRKGGKRGQKKQQRGGKHASLNKFQVLEEEEEIKKVDQVMEGSLREKEKEEDREQTQDSNK